MQRSPDHVENWLIAGLVVTTIALVAMTVLSWTGLLA